MNYTYYAYPLFKDLYLRTNGNDFQYLHRSGEWRKWHSSVKEHTVRKLSELEIILLFGVIDG